MNLLDTFDTYLQYPREQAYNFFIDEKNLRIFRRILNLFILICLIICIVNIATVRTLNYSLIIAFINLTGLLTLRILYNRFFNQGNIRRSVFIFLIVQMILFISIELFYPHEKDKEVSKDKKEEVQKETKGNIKFSVSEDSGEDYLEYIIFFGIFVLIFRFTRTEIIQLFAIAIFFPFLLNIILQKEFTPDNLIPNIITGVLLFVIAFTSERKRQKNFYSQYDVNYKKNYETLRMKKELNYAREIQLSMLPDNEAVIGELKISGVSNPATEVGGDYFDYFRISERETGFFICDVSGHGVASGLLLSGLRSCVHLLLEDNVNPKIIMEKLNRMIRKTQNRKMFVTAIFAVIDTENNKCRLFNAGHLPPYKISGESGEIFKIRKHGIALGAMNSVDASEDDNEVVIDFKKNDKIVFYTDGVNEAMNSKNAEYGLDNLEYFLNNNSGRNSDDILKGLLTDVKRFTGGSVQKDDLTLLIIQRI